MSNKFAVGDRVEFVPNKEDEAYPGDLAQYRGEQGTIVEAYTDEEDAFFTPLFGEGHETVGVHWDTEFMRTALSDDNPLWGDTLENRSAWEENVRKIEEAD